MPEQPEKLPAWRVITTFMVGIVLLVVLVYSVAKPLRAKLAERFLERGNTYFASLQFEVAEKEYDKALAYDSSLQEARTNKDLAVTATTDIAKARAFFVDHGATETVSKIDAATQQFSTPKEALVAGVTLYTKGEFSYAQYPLEQAVEKDPGYSEAWHYLYLTDVELAKESAAYRDKAEEARQKRDALTPKYLNPNPAGVQ